jgi:DUF2911 family protein
MNLNRRNRIKMKLRIAVLSVLALSLIASAVMAQGRGAAEVTIKGKKISIDYGRPNLGGRDIVSMAKVGDVWRVGNNMSTSITTEADLVVGGTTVKAGKYSLWAKKTGPDSWTLNFHPKTGVWGAPPLTEGYIAEMPLKTSKVGDSAEQLVISLADNKGKAVVTIHWGTAELIGAFDVK